MQYPQLNMVDGYLQTAGDGFLNEDLLEPFPLGLASVGYIVLLQVIPLGALGFVASIG